MRGTILKQMRISSGLTQKQLAENLGISPQTLSGYETGYGEPNFSTVLKIAQLCEFTVQFVDDNSDEILTC
jgi:transcriptional regulator with XRE-family HTH domain